MVTLSESFKNCTSQEGLRVALGGVLSVSLRLGQELLLLCWLTRSWSNVEMFDASNTE